MTVAALVLDTDALHDGRLRAALTQARGAGVRPDQLQVVLPAVAYAERVRQLRKAGAPAGSYRPSLALMGIEVEPLTEAEAARVPHGALDDHAWRAHARDFLIAAHVHGDRVAVTSDGGPAWRQVRVLSPRAAAGVVEAFLA